MTVDARILRALRKAEQHLTQSELAGETQTSPAELANRIAELNAAGYEIEFQPHLGYRLISSPDRLIADDLTAMLDGTRIGREILVFHETSSTNDVAARLGRSGSAEGVVVFAERQTAGRGRLGRKWESASHKGLWFSILLRPGIPYSEWARLTTWAAVAIARALERVLPGCHAAVKWPNDIHLNGKKAVGILFENVAAGSSSFAVAGIGVNVNHTQEDFPEEFAWRATSLREVAGHSLDRQQVTVALLQELDRLYDAAQNDFAVILAEAEARSCVLGHWIEVQGVTGKISGQAEALDPDGSLRIRLADGRTMAVSGGEVTVASWG
jgi:BirA family biotin operon repressor/biotin-[acetyl-CoA-carboxylase] ligase